MRYFNRDFPAIHLAIVVFFTLALFLAGCGFIPDPQKKKVSIVLEASDLGDSAFSPNPVVVHFGGHVVWQNNDKFPHSIVGDSKHGPCAFKSNSIQPGMRFSQTFLKRVICNYYCGIHGRAMRGRIIVE